MIVKHAVTAAFAFLGLVPVGDIDAAENLTSSSLQTATWLDLEHVTFSRRGCWLNLALRNDADTPKLYLRSNIASRVTRSREHLRIEFIHDGTNVPVRFTASPASLLASATDGSDQWAEFVLSGEGTLHVRGHGLQLVFAPAKAQGDIMAAETVPGVYALNLSDVFSRYGFSASCGRLHLDAGWDGKNSTHPVISVQGDDWEITVDAFTTTWMAAAPTSFAEVKHEAECDFASFSARLPQVPDRFSESRRYAAYVLWSATKAPRGLFKRPPVLMSLNWMDRVWSWDNLFNALALASADTGLAFDQFSVIADHQDQFGVYPDCIGDMVIRFGFNKPPVQGVLFSDWMRRRPQDWTRERLKAVVPSVARFTQWWLDHRRWPGHSLAHYLHGNDSGWDNSTLFQKGVPVESPDLNAFLILQAEWLAKGETELGHSENAAYWGRTAADLRETLFRALWQQDRFVGRLVPSQEVVSSESLLDCMPIVLGRELPPEIRTALVARIRAFLTPAGLATEKTSSPYYTSDGYWRGPMWAPAVYLIVLGLEDAGETELAREIARRFCAACEKSGFPENFDAQTGAPLRDPSYTWTASVFLLLAGRLDH